ncbi:hypothetical protein O4214_17755 [Rhodococcus erythropolis]|uniref:hypothetical protein n=1 Tax=Rhodococcus erythropolis TaxID=1833 RepID=UPI001E65A849|nr:MULTISPECIES: hypothetical protein [Rhodococcus erythropolis group]MCD2106996.1 hypothetical protein [Rhodococcus qingshengii]MCZ4525837.1 hypothetical protein [Rhodococcus erythropolis]
MWATILSVVAISATVVNFLFTQWRTDRREVDKWRRDELLRLVSSMLALSSQREAELSADLSSLEAEGRASPDDSDPWALTRQMKIVVQQILLLDESLSQQANKICLVHVESETGYYPDQNPYNDTGQLLPDRDRLEKAHHELVATFRSNAWRRSRVFGRSRSI